MEIYDLDPLVSKTQCATILASSILIYLLGSPIFSQRQYASRGCEAVSQSVAYGYGMSYDREAFVKVIQIFQFYKWHIHSHMYHIAKFPKLPILKC